MPYLGRYLTPGRAAIAAAFAAPLATAAILLPFRASWSNTNVALLLVVVVVAVAAIGNRVAGALAAVLAFAWFDFFFTLPYYRFTIRSSSDVTTAVLLLVTGLVVSQLAATDAGYLALIHQTAELSRTERSPFTVVDLVREQLPEGSAPSLQARLVAVTLADQAGRALGTSQEADAGSAAS